MKLAIDTSKQESFLISINGKSFECQSKNNKSQILLSTILEKLKELELSLSDITEIEVFEGPGSFTGLRVGASVGQTLSWALNIPVNGEKVSKVHFIKLKYFPTSFD